ncbi:MAG: YdcF family protein, partial [Planctomycetes bacterium]|nr:YdcF family protein [Planctomycetota bacterium]
VSDGSMSTELLERLAKGLELAKSAPLASVIVSGGLPERGATESQHMRDWLIRQGVPRSSIFEDGYSRDLLENIIYSRHILDLLQAKTAVIVSSAINVRRAGAVGEICAWRNGSGWAVQSLSGSGESFDSFADDGRDRLKVFRDGLRAFGVPTMIAYPELVDR